MYTPPCKSLGACIWKINTSIKQDTLNVSKAFIMVLKGLEINAVLLNFIKNLRKVLLRKSHPLKEITKADSGKRGMFVSKQTPFPVILPNTFESF